MASLQSMYCDDGSDSCLSQDEFVVEDSCSSDTPKDLNTSATESSTKFSLIHKLVNRQIYGRVTKNPRAKTEPLLEDVHSKCRYRLDQLISSPDMFSHIFMGFTICGKYFITYKEKLIEDLVNMFMSLEYDVYVWKFIPGEHLKYISNHRVFKLLKGSEPLEDLTLIQYPTDPYKLYCYGIEVNNPIMAYLTVLTLPMDNCVTCKENSTTFVDDRLNHGWCVKHGFMLHYMFSMAQPNPRFDPNLSLAYRDHVVFNTGHCIHILHVATYKPVPQHLMTFHSLRMEQTAGNNSCGIYTNDRDNCSELSESVSCDNFSANSIVDAIIEDFNEYDLEGGDCNKPFHELNISCEPLNLTGRSYHNALVQNIVDPRLKRLQSNVFSLPAPPPPPPGGSDLLTVTTATPLRQQHQHVKNIAEKAYEFTEETDTVRCEKLSSFRKKRLADKKYEFCEDNTENIVPFNSLRRERRYLYRSSQQSQQQQQQRGLKSPEFSGGINSGNPLFLSPRSPGVWSPMQSPNYRSTNGQYSPRSNIYCPALVRSSPHHSGNTRSPISPKENSSTRRIHVYSPSLDSDCSECSDSKLVLRQINNFASVCDQRWQQPHLAPPPQPQPVIQTLNGPTGLLIVDPKTVDAPKWIKKVVKRYSSNDFETSSLVSGHSRDDYNIPIEIPLIVQTLGDQQLEVVSEFREVGGHVRDTQLLITQRTFDSEQFVQRRAQKLCADAQLQFLHCEDYDIKLLDVCPLSGLIIAHSVILMCALRLSELHARPHLYVSTCLLSWCIDTDAFEIIEISDTSRLQLYQRNSGNTTNTAAATTATAKHRRKASRTSSGPISNSNSSGGGGGGFNHHQLPTVELPLMKVPRVWVMNYKPGASKKVLRDYRNQYEIVLDTGLPQYINETAWGYNSTNGYLTMYDSDSDIDY